MPASQDAIDILKSGVKNWNKWREENKTTKLNLVKADLQGANLWGADLERANLQQANLQQANLNGADLQEANLNWLRFDGHSAMQQYRWEEEHQHG